MSVETYNQACTVKAIPDNYLMKETTYSSRCPRLFFVPVACLLLAAVARAEDLAPYSFNHFFDTSRLVKIDLKVDPGDWNKLRVQHRSLVKTLRTDIPPSEREKPFDYVPANLTIDGTGVGKVAIRKKGFVGSLDHNRPSFKIQIDKYEKKKMFAGVDTLTLNNNKQDGSRVHQLVGYQFFRAAGLPASHCNLALVSVNGKSLGVYSNVESLDKHHFRRALKSAKGTLYEGTVCDFHVHSLVRFERKFGSKKAIASIKNASIALDSDDRSILDKLGRHLDLDQFYRYWAAEVLIGHWDGYVSNKNNYFVYFDSKSERLHFLPWGLDQLATDRNMFWRQGFDPPKSVKADAAIPRRLYKNLEAKKQYFVAMQSLLTEVWDEDKLIKQIDDLQAMINPHRIEKSFWSRRHATSFQKFISRRRAEILDEIGGVLDVLWRVKVGLTGPEADNVLALADGKFPEWTLEPREMMGEIVKVADSNSTFSLELVDTEKGRGGFVTAKGTGQMNMKYGNKAVAFGSPTYGVRQNGRRSVTLRIHRENAADGEPEAVEVTFPRPRLTDERPEASYRIDVFASPAQGDLFVSNSREPLGRLAGNVVFTRFGTDLGDIIEGRLESEVFRFLQKEGEE